MVGHHLTSLNPRYLTLGHLSSLHTSLAWALAFCSLCKWKRQCQGSRLTWMDLGRGSYRTKPFLVKTLGLAQSLVSLASFQSSSSSQCPCCSKGGLVTGTGALREQDEYPPPPTTPGFLCDSARALRVPRAEILPARSFILKPPSSLKPNSLGSRASTPGI